MSNFDWDGTAPFFVVVLFALFVVFALVLGQCTHKKRQADKAKCWEKAATFCQDRPDQVGCVKTIVELCDDRR